MLQPCFHTLAVKAEGAGSMFFCYVRTIDCPGAALANVSSASCIPSTVRQLAFRKSIYDFCKLIQNRPRPCHDASKNRFFLPLPVETEPCTACSFLYDWRKRFFCNDCLPPPQANQSAHIIQESNPVSLKIFFRSI